MISKNHRQNSNFQIAYFLVGSCHTADGAYSLLCDLREERQNAINNYDVSLLRIKAKKIRAQKLIILDDEARMERDADILEISYNEKAGEVLYAAAVDELNFIDKCIEAINPLRKYKCLPDSEAHTLMQFDEWMYELIRRAENFLLTVKYIPTDQFETMRQHPAFVTDILPAIIKMETSIKTEDNLQQFLKEYSTNVVITTIEKLLT